MIPGSTTLATTTARLPRPRAVGILAAAVLVAAGTYLVSAFRPTPAAAPHPPIVETPIAVPADLGTTGAAGSVAQLTHSIQTWAGNLSRNPNDFIGATNLATLYHARGRLTADLDDQERALEAARTAIRIAPGQPAARIIEAVVLFSLHEFEAAEVAAAAVYRDDPTQLAALATRLDAELELGRLEAGRTDAAKLAAATSGPAVDIRLARLAYLTGDAAQALRLATGACDATVQAGDDPTFYDYAVGEYARLSGDPATAREAYAAALGIRSTDLAALVGMARIDAATGHPDAAIDGLRRAAAIAPQPDTLALLGDLLAARGDAKGAAAQYATVRLTGTLSSIAGSVYDRQLLLFELDHGGASPAILDQAVRALAARPDAFGHDIVAWADYRLGRFDAAATESGLARAAGLADARILYHAGAIAIARGDPAGRSLVRAALALGPALDPIDRAAADVLIGR